MRLYADAPALVGRSQEAAVLSAAMRDGARGQPRTVLLHGEAGIGKTRLASEVCAREREGGAAVLWGQCVNFGATSAPYLPLLSAFEDWLEATSRRPDAVLDLLTALSGEAGTGTARLVRLLGAALAAVTKDGPAVLVVDDVQWSDTSTLDLLAYTLATGRLRRLTVLVTYRDAGLIDGHYLHAWLADVSRLPGVCDVRLGPLVRQETEIQVARLLGGPVRMSLVDAVWTRSGGNPYLTELLLRDVSPEAERLPEGMPDGLRTALLAAWHRLSPEGRQFTRLLSAAQRPLPDRELHAVSGHLNRVGELRDLSLAAEESVSAGVVTRDRSGNLWFHHPMVAEVLYQEMPATERRELHAAFLAALEQPAQVEPRMAPHLALHAERAGFPDRAFDYALVAANHAADLHALPEEAEQRRRAAQLWGSVSPAARKHHSSQARMWCDAAEAAERVGWDGAAAEAAEEARRTMDAVTDPAVAARAVRTWTRICRWGRMDSVAFESCREAVRLAAASPDRVELASCLVDLSEIEMWGGGLAAARRSADEAMRAAELSGSKGAFARALGIRALTYSTSERELGEVYRPGEQGLTDAEKAYGLALEAGDEEAITSTCIARSNILGMLHRFDERAEVWERAYALAVERGFGSQQQRFAAATIFALMDIGRYDDARRMLTLALAVPAGGIGGLWARLNGVELELYVGDVEAATRHLGRAREIAPNFETLPGDHGLTTLAKYHIVSGHPQLAIQTIHEHFSELAAGEPPYGDWMLLWAAIATGNVTKGAALGTSSDARADVARQRAALRAIIAARESLDGEPFPPTDAISQAYRIVLDAELARAFGDDDEVDHWRALTFVSEFAGEAWIMTQAVVHWAQCLLQARSSRTELEIPLRRAQDRAQRFGFRLLQVETEDLARQARIPLTGTSTPFPARETPAGLTNRELEVLSHLADGRTYAEIAQTLFISQKTVGVHVSHILQKTRTSSRAEAAAWAWHNGMLGSPV